ncbi:solute carrier family 28 member 3-like isoform X1 [Mercenaria mercenaria]|uniref:solute carrier family 28 member 3-like isoform X1 n=1 Tax=Mercenaria mercenaria TaxID=6596 RepID=UPI00234EF11B|nr:solute carrier family 28 member 3-like isoform X1 [Mercenaria mercenaria]
MELVEIKTEIPSVAAKIDHTGEISCINFADQISGETNGDQLKFVVGSNPMMRITQKTRIYLEDNFDRIILLGKVLLFLGYFVYFGFALSYHIGDEGSWRLIGCTILGVWITFWSLLKKTRCYSGWSSFVDKVYDEYAKGKRSLIVRWCLYVAMTAFMVVYVILFVARKTPENLRSLVGLFGFPFLLFLYSNNKRKINWHTIYWAMALQFSMALLILKTSWGASIIRWCGARLEAFISNGEAGSIFIFGEKYKDHPFAFGSMVQVFVLIIGMSVLTYLGVIKFVVETVGRALAFCIGTSPSEGINAVGNMFLHVPESVMLIQEYLPEMTPSQLFVTYAGGMATVGGVSLVIFMSSGVPAAPLVAASAMSAPAALAVAKLCFPSHDEEDTPIPINDGKSLAEKISFLRHPKSLMDSIILGIRQSISLVVQGVAYVMTFVIILEFVNNTLIWFGDRIGVENMTIEFLFSYVFYPFAFMMGAKSEDCLFIGELLGIRTFSLAIVAYPKLGPIMKNGVAYRDYIGNSVNNTWTAVGNDIFLDNLNHTLVGGVIDPRSEIIATYSLCGSASFAIMGLIIGSFEVIVPHRIGEITENIFRAMIAGTVASYLTACFAGNICKLTVVRILFHLF